MERLSGCNKDRFSVVENPIHPSFKVNTNGLSYPRASLYGMPHINCDPRGISGSCAICGNRATEKHHMAPIGKGNKYLTVLIDDGFVKLESALIALCHECHDKFPPQGFDYSVGWYWKDQLSANLFWSGAYLRSGRGY